MWKENPGKTQKSVRKDGKGEKNEKNKEQGAKKRANCNFILFLLM